MIRANIGIKIRFEVFNNVSWDFGDGNTSSENNPTHTYNSKGWYDVTLTVDFILGCSYSITKSIYIGDEFELVVPNAFTENGDGFHVDWNFRKGIS